jgi:hypothetical protein
VLISDKVNIWREIEADGAGIVAPDTVKGTRDLLTKWGANRMFPWKARACYEHHFTASRTAAALLEVLAAR